MIQQTAKKTALKPLGNRVLIKREEQEDTVKGGILLPDSAKKKQETGKVIAVGPGKMSKEGKREDIPVKVGDIVLMNKYSGQEVTIDEEIFIILDSDDIIAIIN